MTPDNEPELEELDARHAQERESEAAKHQALAEPIADFERKQAREREESAKLLASLDAYGSGPTDISSQRIHAREGYETPARVEALRVALKERAKAWDFALGGAKNALAAAEERFAKRELERVKEREDLLEKIRLEDERLIRAMARRGVTFQ